MLNKVKHIPIGLITVYDAILTGRQSGQCLFGNPMANNFSKNLILHNL